MIPREESPEIIVLLVGHPEEDDDAEESKEPAQSTPALSSFFGRHGPMAVDHFDRVERFAKRECDQSPNHKPSRNLKRQGVRMATGLQLQFIGLVLGDVAAHAILN